MKRILLVVCVLLMALNANAQLMRTEELDAYAKEKYGEKWTEAAENLASTLSLDKNNSITYSQVVECPGQTKEQLYVLLNYWFSASFNDANSVIQLNDKEQGVIIAQGYVSNVAQHTGGSNAYVVDLKPVIKVDIKNEKIRITYTLQGYNVIKSVGGGILGAMSGVRPTNVEQVWVLEKTFPFAEKDAYKAKKTESKALVMAHAYSNVIMDKIEEAVKNGIVGNENDDW
ncbi:MAG: DUF4468 domain-containing protein [Bacteroidaceae bacterium]|nr:DUF4468 domain-containing protein [Bacteroidaceae bacterium]